MICFFIHGGKHVIIDNEDYHLVSLFSWHLDKDGYARTSLRSLDGKVFVFSMHRLISRLNFGDKTQVDHIDGDKTNNTKNNLRICLKHENAKNRLKSKNNTTGYKGVHYFKGKYVSQILVNKKRIYLGRFETPKDAHAAYCVAAREYYGEFASTGF